VALKKVLELNHDLVGSVVSNSTFDSVATNETPKLLRRFLSLDEIVQAREEAKRVRIRQLQETNLEAASPSNAGRRNYVHTLSKLVRESSSPRGSDSRPYG
jgi:hypothetical protein